MTRSASRLKQVATEWLLPPGVKRLASRALGRHAHQVITPAEKAILAGNATLAGAYAGRRCFVLGNGPSLAKVDLAPLAGEVTIVMNAFNQHPAARLWQPTFHCMAEPADAYSKPHMLDLLKTCLAGYTTSRHVFPIEARAVVEGVGLIPTDRLVFVKQQGTAAEYERIDLTGFVPTAHDTSILAVCLAIALGCSPIVLLGVDYTWLSHRSTHTHFYDDDAVPWPSVSLGTYAYLEQIKFALSAWEAHASLRRIAAAGGQTIVNATEGSFLDVYPMTTLAALLAPA